jgi:hypothetical protein
MTGVSFLNRGGHQSARRSSVQEDAQMAEPVPLPLGRLKGEGRWSDQKVSGRYSVEFSIERSADGSTALSAHRVFFNPDGSPGGVEDSLTTFQPTFECFFSVSIYYKESTREGNGYCYGGQGHYGFDVDPDTRVEYTWKLGPSGEMEGMGSSTNRGNFTAWSETLQAES